MNKPLLRGNNQRSESRLTLSSLCRKIKMDLYELITYIYMKKGESANEALRKMDKADFYYVGIFCRNLSEGGS